MRKILSIAVVLFIAGTVMAFAKGYVPKATVTAEIGKDGIQRVSIEGGEYYFSPDHIIVKVNVPVEMTVSKTGGYVPHDIVIDAKEAGIYVKEQLDKTPKVIKFTPKKAGKFPIICSEKFLFFRSHKDKGMEGQLEVRE